MAVCFLPPHPYSPRILQYSVPYPSCFAPRRAGRPLLRDGSSGLKPSPWHCCPQGPGASRQGCQCLPKQLLTLVWLRNAQHSPVAMGLHLLIKRPLQSSETFCCVLELAVLLYRTLFSTALGADAAHLSSQGREGKGLASSTLKVVQRRAS